MCASPLSPRLPADINGADWDDENGINGPEVDFLLCIGDGKTDEPVFALLGHLPYCFTVTVGKKQTRANYYLDSVGEVHRTLVDLVHAIDTGSHAANGKP